MRLDLDIVQRHSDHLQLVEESLRSSPESTEDADLPLWEEHTGSQMLFAYFADMPYVSIVATETEICFNASY